MTASTHLFNIERLQFSDGFVALTPPAAPVIGTATAGNATASVSFTAPASAIPLTFTAQAVPVVVGSAPVVTVANIADGSVPATVNGLVNGVQYQLQVAASNQFGQGPFSALSNTVIPSTVPGAPTAVSATVLSPTSGRVTWTPPASNGGSAITGYSVRVLNAANAQVGALRPAAAGATSLDVTLTTGQAVHFTVTANNLRGAGPASASSNTITPAAAATAPSAPAIGPATVAGATSATVRWAVPANGGSAITGYSVRVLNAANVQIGALRPAPGAATVSLVVTGLTTGQAYHFTVTATNGVGTSPASASSNTVTPTATTAPSAPAIGQATAASATSATVRWAVPANGGSAITGYSVRVLNAANVQIGALRPAPGAATVSLVVTGLTTGQAYHFTVTATNGVGTSPASASSNTVTLIVPATPVIGVAVAGAAGGAITATANWAAPAANAGPAITGYQVIAVRLSAANVVLSTTTSTVQPAAARTLSMTLPVAGNYRFTVRAINIVGSSAQSARSNLVAGR